jgi:putative heme-binding domain-containing protein
MNRAQSRSTLIALKKRPALWCAVVVFGSGWTLSAQDLSTIIMTQGHPQDYSQADIMHGARIYADQCDRCHGKDGAGVSGVDFRSGRFRNADTDRALGTVITRGITTSGMPAFAFDPADLSGVIAYLRNFNNLDRGSLRPGDPGRGRLVFEGKGACLSCHRVQDKGSRKAPDLSEIGALRSAGIIERSLTDPNGQLLPINRPVHIVTRDGKTIDGRRLNEDTYTVQIADSEGRLLSFSKANLREFTVSTKAAMPSYKGELAQDELADLISYLLTLKGQ